MNMYDDDEPTTDAAPYMRAPACSLSIYILIYTTTGIIIISYYLYCCIIGRTY